MKRWYIIHAYSGYEKQVMRSLNDRIQRSAVADSFGDVLVPTEEVVEMKDGKKRKSERKFFPGYVLVEMEMNDETWHIVKECPKVLGFIGGTAEKPAPITQREADAILREEFEINGLAEKVWQYFIAVPDFKSVGVKDGKRYEGWPAIIRAVNTTDAMSATIEEVPYPILHKITDRITHEVPGINRALYDLTPKPIATIEWE